MRTSYPFTVILVGLASAAPSGNGDKLNTSYQGGKYRGTSSNNPPSIYSQSRTNQQPYTYYQPEMNNQQITYNQQPDTHYQPGMSNQQITYNQQYAHNEQSMERKSNTYIPSSMYSPPVTNPVINQGRSNNQPIAGIWPSELIGNSGKRAAEANMLQAHSPSGMMTGSSGVRNYGMNEYNQLNAYGQPHPDTRKMLPSDLVQERHKGFAHLSETARNSFRQEGQSGGMKTCNAIGSNDVMDRYDLETKARSIYPVTSDVPSMARTSQPTENEGSQQEQVPTLKKRQRMYFYLVYVC